ncbi:MAG: MTH865 family protein [Desulfobaccales bacterium]
MRNQIIGALGKAGFPIDSPEALLAAFPQGAATECRAGEIAMTAGEAGKLLKPEDFPFRSAEQAADTILSRAGF